jgi:phenylacetate-coenzyme A ligase PaaK-like adenylate-forming protein
VVRTGLARFRLAASIAFGTPVSTRSLERLVDAARERVSKGGTVAGSAGLLGASATDQDTRRWVTERGFRRQAVKAARETSYYEQLFRELGIDPSGLAFDEIASVPITSKQALRERPDAFVCRGSRPYLHALTTGTTGVPACISYSRREIDSFSCMSALHALASGDIRPDDIVAISISLRAALASAIAAGTCARVGASAYFTGQIEPASALELLSRRRDLPGKVERTSVMLCYASYLGTLVEHGNALGYGPHDFGLRSIRLGGEIVTEGLLKRARALFGEVEFVQGYATNELDPLSGTLCSEGHLHFQPSAGLLELESLEGDGPPGAGEPGTIIATPFGPYRETTLLLRYDTQDVAHALPGSLTCELAHLPGITRPVGRLPLSVKHDDGWTFQRQVLEAVEHFEDVPLPTRFGFWAASGGVAVELRTRTATPSFKDAIASALEEQGVPLRELQLVDDPALLQHPLPVRADLREVSFEQSAPRSSVVAGVV